MISIAITGNFCSGKSYLLNYLLNLGFKTFSCDEFVADLYKDQDIQNKVLKILKIEFFDKANITKIIYCNDKFRKDLEKFIHPIVFSAIEDFKKKNFAEQFIFVEVPLLFESGFDKYFDYIITAICDEESRLKLAKKRPNFDQEIYDKISQIQLPQSEKIKLSDLVIDNSYNFKNSTMEIEKMLTELRMKL